jgi:excinuclease ABC subunit C
MDKTKLELLPQSPGIYKFLNEKREILYIGKATNLRSRVRSYFSKDIYDRPRIKQMIPLIDDVEIIETNNDIESLVLESMLIKKYKPFYNTDLKDDKSYVWIYISTKDVFPTVKIVRKISNKELIKGKLFGPYPSSSATKRIFTYLRKLYPFCTCKKENSKECLYFHLGLCPGPHQGHISKEKYRNNINEIIKFLQGRKRGQIKELEKEMKEYSKNREYEKAIQIRDRISDLKYLGEDVDFSYQDTDKTYLERRRETLKRNFLNLKTELSLKSLNRIECYDVSNIQGKNAYVSMVVAKDGEIDRNEYRIFKIRGEEKADDPKMLKEAVERRFNKLNTHKYSENPELVLIDGGKSQLSVIKDIIPKNITLLAISKGKRLKRKGKKTIDEFWILIDNEIKKVDINNKEILIDLRDEAHRFAILHHRKSRRKETISSELEKISGVGVKRRKDLMKSFGSIEKIKKTNIEELDTVIKNKKVSKNIIKYFNSN